MGVWGQMTPEYQLGIVPSRPESANTNPTPGIARSAGPGLAEAARPFHPDSPLFWFGAIAAVTLGLVGVSTSARVGPFRASASAGNS